MGVQRYFNGEFLMKESQLVNQADQTNGVTKSGEWRHFILLMVIVLPILAFCAIGAYGLFVWIMQLLFWGPPT